MYCLLFRKPHPFLLTGQFGRLVSYVNDMLWESSMVKWTIGYSLPVLKGV